MADGVISAALGAYGDTVVERFVFGTDDPGVVTALVSDFCDSNLGSPLDGALFYEASVGAVIGARLEDGRQVVVKAHPPQRSPYFLAAVAEVQLALHHQGFPAARPLVGPATLGLGYGTAEELLAIGRHGDAHRPPIRKEMARGLAELIDLLKPHQHKIGLREDWQPWFMRGALWPEPRSRFLDYHAEAGWAGWIEELGLRARSVLLRSSSEPVLGHSDWSVKNMRFLKGKIGAVYDWDSLRVDREAHLVGSAAAHFTATWYLDVDKAPSAQEADAFVEEYEVARGRPFSSEDRTAARAAIVYAMAFTALCEHASRGGDDNPGGFRDALRRDSDHYLAS